MKATATEAQILDLLKQAKSYSDIQFELSVSPARIVLVKKKHAKELAESLEKLESPKVLTEKEIQFNELREKLRAKAVKIKQQFKKLEQKKRELEKNCGTDTEEHRIIMMEMEATELHEGLINATITGELPMTASDLED